MNSNSANLLKKADACIHAALEYKSKAEILSLQERLLTEHIEYTFKHSPYYKSLFASHNIDPGSIKRISDLSTLPCTSKKDLIDQNEAFLACGKAEIADICLTSATTGDKPTILYQTQDDLSRLAYNEEATLRMIGIKPDDKIIIFAAIDRCFMAGLAYYLGAMNIGATAIRAGAGSPAQQWELIKATSPTVIIGVPSLIRKIGQHAIEKGQRPDKTPVHSILGIGEALRSEDLKLLPVASSVEQLWSAKIYSTYASSEMATAFSECREASGGHLRPELLVLEILDDDSNPVAAGEKGEVTVTPLGVKGMPLIRFKTGDISFLIKDECPCGRKTPRLGPIIGRKNQMLKLKGTTIFPSAILSSVEAVDGVEGGYIEVLRNSDGTDDVILYVAISDASITLKYLVDTLRAKLRVVPQINIISSEELHKKISPPDKRKKITFFDLR